MGQGRMGPGQNIAGPEQVGGRMEYSCNGAEPNWDGAITEQTPNGTIQSHKKTKL